MKVNYSSFGGAENVLLLNSEIMSNTRYVVTCQCIYHRNESQLTAILVALKTLMRIKAVQGCPCTQVVSVDICTLWVSWEVWEEFLVT